MKTAKLGRIEWYAQMQRLMAQYGVEQYSDQELATMEDQRRLGEWPQAVAWELWGKRRAVQ